MTSPVEGADYEARRSSFGGSPKGRDVRKPDPVLKLATYRWVVAEIGGGNEATFFRRVGGSPASRFTPSAFNPLVPLLLDYFPVESGKYLGGRLDNASYLLSQRFHKMYYGTTKSKKGRGEASREHPKNWSSEARARAEAKLVEAGWPW